MPGFLRDEAESLKIRIAPRCLGPQRPDALCNLVHGERELRVLGFEERVERREHRTGYIPVEIVRLQIERVTGREHPLELANNGLVRFIHAGPPLVYSAASSPARGRTTKCTGTVGGAIDQLSCSGASSAVRR